MHRCEEEGRDSGEGEDVWGERIREEGVVVMFCAEVGGYCEDGEEEVRRCD